MTLEEIRKEIDAIDPRIRALLMERLDCAYRVAEAKNISGDLRVYRPAFRWMSLPAIHARQTSISKSRAKAERHRKNRDSGIPLTRADQ